MNDIILIILTFIMGAGFGRSSRRPVAPLIKESPMNKT